MSVKDFLIQGISRKNKHKFITVGYAFAIAGAFALSLINNNDVNASVAPDNRSEYVEMSNGIRGAMVPADTLYPESPVENIRSLFELVTEFEYEKDVDKVVEVKSGDTLISVLTNLGASRDLANDVYYELKKVFDPRDLRAGQKLNANLTVNSQTDELVKFNSLLINDGIAKRYIVERNDEDAFSARIEKDELIEEVNSVQGIIDGNLSVTMQKHGISSKTIAEFIKIFSYSVDFRRDLRKGDKFEIIYENQITPDGKVVKSGDVLYAGLQLRNHKIALYRFKDSNGDVDYYNEKGLALKKTLHRKPMEFQRARISSPFGKRRHPIYRDIRIHWGIDYAAPRGTAIYAGGDGVVLAAKYNGGYGNYIKIRHNSEFATAYGHMQRFAKGIRPGVRVKQGQVIGYVGSTGRSTGPHLHYEVIQNGRRVNPLTIKAAAGENLKGRNLANFKKVIADLKTGYPSLFANAGSDKLVKK